MCGDENPAPPALDGGGRGDLVVVANRLPVHRTDGGWETSPGGLVSGLLPLLQKRQGVWVGWGGGRASGEIAPFRHDGLWNVPVSLSADEVRDYYEGFANSTLWPLYHDACQQPQFHRQWWQPYVTVNERFAEVAAREAAPGASVLVQDYHLQLVPGMLRRMRPDLRIGFFLHIPFPPVELFSQLPWRQRILEGLLGADVVGFQTKQGAGNFIRLVNRYTPHRGASHSISVYGRRVEVREFPISIDYWKIDQLAADPATIERAREIRAELGPNRTIMLGVDRLDYTKGIDHRIRAFHEILAAGRHTVRDLVLVQVSVPSRDQVDEYIEIRERIETLVGHINGEFGEVGQVPVHYLPRSLPIEKLVAYYLAADLMLVTSLRDGMNLVAKEYCAARRDDTGVLVLSEFTGAAHELQRAVLVNPHDIDGMAVTIERAIAMPRDEQARRMRSLRQRVRKRTAYDWADEFIAVLAGPAHGSSAALAAGDAR
ncbi:MAG: trehalose-6-phosphate synthase [Actinomycetota bacterium]|nr:trehalose-6-phosphate synthase [Actinomycetota bacterium]